MVEKILMEGVTTCPECLKQIKVKWVKNILTPVQDEVSEYSFKADKNIVVPK